MKAILTSLLLVCSMFSHGQYHPLINEANTWSGIVYGMWPTLFYESMEGDSVIGTTTYKKVWEKVSIDGPRGLIGLIREDAVEQKVYHWSNGAEYLLYDFSAEVGDQITLQYDVITITDVDTIQVNGTDRKVLHYEDGSWTSFSIEGIGSAHRIMEIYLGFIFDYGPTLACFHEGEVEAWTNPEIFDPCNLVIAVAESAGSGIRIWQSSPSGMLYINTNDMNLGTCQMKLFSSVGTLVYSRQLCLYGMTEVELPDLDSGIYLLSIDSEEKRLTSLKLVRN